MTLLQRQKQITRKKFCFCYFYSCIFPKSGITYLFMKLYLLPNHYFTCKVFGVLYDVIYNEKSYYDGNQNRVKLSVIIIYSMEYFNQC